MPSSYIQGPQRCPGRKDGKHKWAGKLLDTIRKCKNCTAEKRLYLK